MFRVDEIGQASDARVTGLVPSDSAFSYVDTVRPYVNPQDLVECPESMQGIVHVGVRDAPRWPDGGAFRGDTRAGQASRAIDAASAPTGAR